MKLLIMYGTLTMNTEMVSQTIFEIASENPDVEVDLKSMIEIMEPSELEQYDCFIVGTSTWGEGDYPPDPEDFMNLVLATPPNISGKKAAFFGLGESTYENFCGAIKRMREHFLNELGVTEMGELKLIDGYPEDSILEEMKSWTKTVIQEMQS